LAPLQCSGSDGYGRIIPNSSAAPRGRESSNGSEEIMFLCIRRKSEKSLLKWKEDDKKSDTQLILF